MFPLFAYTGIVALAICVAQAMQPSEALQGEHHRKLYWTGAVASLGFLGAVGAVLATS